MGPTEVLLILLIVSVVAGPTLYPFLAKRWKPMKNPFFRFVRNLKKRYRHLKEQWNRMIQRLMLSLGKVTRLLIIAIVVSAVFLFCVIAYIISGYVH